MTEIQGKSILVRVSARFELARVRVIGSRLYFGLLVMCVNPQSSANLANFAEEYCGRLSEITRPTRVRKSYKAIKKYRLGTSGKRSSHIPASKRVNLRKSGLRFNLRENI